jgi:hypothetical protein
MQVTITNRLVIPVTVFCLVAASNVGRSLPPGSRTVPSLRYLLLQLSTGCLSADSLYLLTDIVRVKVILRPTVSRPVYLGVKPHLRPKTRILLLSDSCGFVDVGHHFWREDGCIVYNCCCPSRAQSFSGPSPAGFMTVFYCLKFETPPAWKARPPSLSSRNND